MAGHFQTGVQDLAWIRRQDLLICLIRCRVLVRREQHPRFLALRHTERGVGGNEAIVLFHGGQELLGRGMGASQRQVAADVGRRQRQDPLAQRDHFVNVLVVPRLPQFDVRLTNERRQVIRIVFEHLLQEVGGVGIVVIRIVLIGNEQTVAGFVAGLGQRRHDRLLLFLRTDPRQRLAQAVPDFGVSPNGTRHETGVFLGRFAV